MPGVFSMPLPLSSHLATMSAAVRESHFLDTTSCFERSGRFHANHSEHIISWISSISIHFCVILPQLHKCSRVRNLFSVFPCIHSNDAFGHALHVHTERKFFGAECVRLGQNICSGAFLSIWFFHVSFL